MTRETIDHVTLARLIEAHAVRGTNVVGQPGGWGVVILDDMTERALAAKRGAPRVFAKFETLVGYLKKLGIANYQVDASGYDPHGQTAARQRVDVSQRLKDTHRAAAYSTWFSQQVQTAIDDPHPSVPHDQVVSDWEREREELLRIAGKGPH